MKADRSILTLLFLGILLLSISLQVSAQQEQDNQITAFFFWGEGCPRCQRVNDSGVLEEISNLENVTVKRLEVYLNQSNQALFSEYAEKLGISNLEQNVPFLVVECDEKLSYLLSDEPIISNLRDKDYLDKLVNCNLSSTEEKHTIEVPFIGEIDLSSGSLGLVTILIAFVDGFNPCSLWVLTFLLGIVINTGSRKKIVIVGLTFLFVTTAAYGAFMLGLFNIFRFTEYMTWIKVVVASIATIFAAVNIKDYFWYKKGLSFTISDKYKPKFFKDVRQIMKGRDSNWAMISGTAIMALGIVLVELPCTAGFPVIWTSIVVEHELTMIAFAAFFLLYLAVYLLDELVVFGTVAFTLKASRFEEKHGRILKLIGGMIMLALAVCLLFFPDIMDDIGGILIVFGIAVIFSFTIMLLHRKILPKFGIKIGSEEKVVNQRRNEIRDDQNEK